MRHVVCVKAGSKYGPRYVNVLHAMVRRHLRQEAFFVCFTDDPDGIDADIETRALPHQGLRKQWNKLALFKRDLELRGTVLFLDLDIAIHRSIDCLFTYEPGAFCIISNFHPGGERSRRLFNSSVFRFEAGTMAHVWERFDAERERVLEEFPGDQSWISRCCPRPTLWPRQWCMSYKWEIQGRELPADCRISIFHGKPKPPDVLADPIVHEAWWV